MVHINTKKWIVRGLIFASVFSVVFYISLQFFVSEKKEVVLPNFEGKSWFETQNILSTLHLKGSIKEERYNFFLQEGIILEQNIEPNQKITEDREISFVVSKGPNKNWKDQLIGKPLIQVQNMLQEQQVSFFETIHICNDKASNAVLDLVWMEKEKKMKILVEDQACQSVWILKEIQNSEYLDSFERDLISKGITLRKIGSFKKNDRILTDPPQGSVVKSGDLVMIRSQS